MQGLLPFLKAARKRLGHNKWLFVAAVSLFIILPLFGISVDTTSLLGIVVTLGAVLIPGGVDTEKALKEFPPPPDILE